MKKAACLILLLAVVLPPGGCSDNVTIVKNVSDPGVVRGNIDPDAGSFTLEVQSAGALFPGPFVIYGEVVEYDEGIGALIVTVRASNASPSTYPLPVRLEFEALLPEGVTVLNPDNGIHGPGAQIEFEFTDRDLHWTPGETSVPHEIQFGVAKGVSIAFAARLLIGPPPELGAIYGTVWNDIDEDGVRDPDDFGIALREVAIAYTDSLSLCLGAIVECQIFKRTTTGVNGEYAFTGLAAGHYTVALVTDRCSMPTTPTILEVFLVESGGGVSDFHGADFGVSLIRDCEPDTLGVSLR